MTITELIQKLEEIRDDFGDLDVVAGVPDEQFGVFHFNPDIVATNLDDEGHEAGLVLAITPPGLVTEEETLPELPKGGSN